MGEEWHPTYPPENAVILDHFGGRYEAGFVALHPFIELPPAIAKGLSEYPSDETVAHHGLPVAWQRVCAETSLASLIELNLALLTSIGALRAEYATPVQCDRLQTYLFGRPIWPPGEGQIEPLLIPPFASLLRSIGFSEFLARDEFGEHVEHLTVPERIVEQRLALGDSEFSVSSLSAPDNSLLAIVHWDSFFTLILGPNSVISEAEHTGTLEGFRCSAETTHLWWFGTPAV